MTAVTSTKPSCTEPPALSPFLEKIVDKRVKGAALSCLELLVHWVCSIFYGSYKMALTDRTTRPAGVANVQKQYWLKGRVRLYDCTKKGLVSILDHEGKKICILALHTDWTKPSGEKVVRKDALPVFLEGQGIEPFSNQTNYVVVKDNKHQVEFEEHIFSDKEPIKRWRTNLGVHGCYGSYHLFAARVNIKKTVKIDRLPKMDYPHLSSKLSPNTTWVTGNQINEVCGSA